MNDEDGPLQVDDDGSGDGEVWGCLWLVVVIGLVGFALYSCTTTLDDDPYFRHTKCGNGFHESYGFATNEFGITADIEVTAAGLPSRCLYTTDDADGGVTFANLLSDPPVAVTVCLGRRGECATGHYSPFPGGRLTLRPGESREIRFPVPRWLMIHGDHRNYPVTVLAVPGVTFTNLDLVVKSRHPAPSTPDALMSP